MLLKFAGQFIGKNQENLPKLLKQAALETVLAKVDKNQQKIETALSVINKWGNLTDDLSKGYNQIKKVGTDINVMYKDSIKRK